MHCNLKLLLQKDVSLADTLVHYESLMMSKLLTVIVASQTKTVYKYLPEHLGKSKCRGEGGCQTGEIFIALDLMKMVSSGCVAEIRCPIRNGLMEGCSGPTMLSRVDWTNCTVVVSVVAVDKCRQAAVGSKNK